MNRPSLFRDMIGFALGGAAASIAAALIYLLLFGMPAPPGPQNHNGESSAPLAVLILVMLGCGGLVGRRGFSAEFLSDLLPSLIVSVLFIGFLCLCGGLEYSKESLEILGCALAGIATSAISTILLARWFPTKAERRRLDHAG